MKKFLFTLAALFMAGSALADSGLYIPDFTLTQEDLGEEIELQVAATFSARISGLDVEFTYPDGIEAVFIEKGADADVAYKNSRGRNATASPALYGAVEPFDHVVLTLADNGYWQDPEGENPTAWVTYGVVKWEGGEYEEFLLLTIVADPTFKGGDIVVKTTVASGTDTRGGTVRENGEHAQAFYYTCHVTVEGAQAEPTEKPVITWTVDEENQQVVVTATGNGTVILYNDDIEVARGEGEATYVVPFTEDPEGEEMGFSATAQEEGKLVSEYALATVEVPGKPAAPEVTATPEIILYWDYEEEYVMISAEGDGTVKLYIDGMEVSNPFMYRFQDEEHEILVEATAQEEGKLISETASETVVIPAKTPEPPTPEVTEKPTITYFVDMDNEEVIITVTGNGTVILYNDDIEVARGEGEATYVVPFTEDPEGEEMGFSATAQEEGKEVSEYALATIEIPGKQPAPYETPAPEVNTELTDDAFVITATGEGTVVVYVQYIDNETGEMTVQTYEGVGSVVVEIPRGEDDAYINYWAVAQADDDAVPGMTEVEYYVEIPAKEEGPVIDPEHQTGWWIVLLDKNGNEIWYRINKGADASYTTTVTLDYGTYGEFYYDPTMSDAENDLNRPNVPFYFVVDGTVWGADEVMKPTAMGESQNTEKNKLYDGAEDYYTVPVGYSYTLGIFVDEYTGEYYVYCAQGKATDVEELNADKTVAGVRYFNLAGQEMQQADGMTIIVTTYTDGTTSAVKVMK